MFFHWNLHSPSFIRETNPEQLERNGDQTIFSYFFVFLDNNIKPTQTFGNNIRPLPITTATPWLSLHSVLTVKNLPRLHRKNGLYALLIVSPSLILTNAMTARIRDSQVISNSLDQTAYSHLSSSTSSFPLSRFLWKNRDMANKTKSESKALNLHVSRVYASRCLTFELSIDLPCLR